MSAPESCPCCGGLVNGNTYELSLIAPPVFLAFTVCSQCEAILTSNDREAHDALVMAAARRIEGGADARTFH